MCGWINFVWLWINLLIFVFIVKDFCWLESYVVVCLIFLCGVYKKNLCSLNRENINKFFF